MKKIGLLVLSGAVLFLTGCCQITPTPPSNTTPPPVLPPRPDESPVGDQASAQEVLDDIVNATGISFEEKGSVTFLWFTTSGEQEEVAGIGMEADMLTDEQIAALDDYFSQYDVSMDNISDGTVAGAMGYEINDQVVCLVSKYMNEEDMDMLDEDEGWDEIDWGDVTTDVSIDCGALDQLLR